MIPQKARLPREEFEARGYRRAATPYFALKFKENTLDGNRIGVVVGKSVDKRATRRNFLERQAKSALMKLPAIGRDMILMVSPRANVLSREEFQKEMKKILTIAR